ncbi:hypothetical protein BST61_g4312 [Cercospora zeina]
MASSSAPSTNSPAWEVDQDRCLDTISRFFRVFFRPYVREDPSFPAPHNILILRGHPDPRPIVAFCNKAQFEQYAVAKPAAADKGKKKQKQKKKQQLSGARNTDEANGAAEAPELPTAVCLNGVDYEVLWKETDLPSEQIEYSEEFWTGLFKGNGELKMPYVMFTDLAGEEEFERVEEEKAVARREKKKAKKERRAAERMVREEEE